MRITEMIAAMLVAAALTALISPVAAADGTFRGRVAISHDGNAHDCDDIASSAVDVALLAATGNTSKLVAAIYADHVWYSDVGGCRRRYGSRERMLRDSMVGTALIYGGFRSDVFVNAHRRPQRAVDVLTTAIEASSSNDPLWIIAAGPMEIIGRALAAASSSHRRYVTVVSHSEWNNDHGGWHGGWTLSELHAQFPEFHVVQLPNQNPGLRTELSAYAEWRKSADARLRWLYTRLKIRSPGVWAAHMADISDAGMTAWLVDGRLRNDDEASPSEIEGLL